MLEYKDWFFPDDGPELKPVVALLVAATCGGNPGAARSHLARMRRLGASTGLAFWAEDMAQLAETFRREKIRAGK